MLLVTICIILLIISLVILIVRNINYTEVDDVHPLIPCKNHLLKNSKYLWVIPIYKNIPITNYPAWCQEIKKLESNGTILGMHGVVHNETHDFLYRDGEFNKDLSYEYIKSGMEVFKNAFGHYPKVFKAPHTLATSNNIHKINQLGMKYFGVMNQITHKVYHCNDDNLPWYLGEKIVDSI
ncbi:MAG: hypothetical protein Edafosvirus3_57 [Edafosvirus sp.]|uniref:DUF2334 domain-containing protein n=1 Tax=Edafosvirus sp. TaxID=2487765 RepID=A0A3G4ZX26_9VIRU|nr:MAG: hypothetical protein Edafosvirus3_57 [Edafosvirus sp.]